MPILRLRPAREDPPMIQCEATVLPPTHDNDWRRRNYQGPYPDHCRRMSAITIDGRSYCRLHAGGLALEKWLSGQLREVESDDVKIHI